MENRPVWHKWGSWICAKQALFSAWNGCISDESAGSRSRYDVAVMTGSHHMLVLLTDSEREPGDVAQQISSHPRLEDRAQVGRNREPDLCAQHRTSTVRLSTLVPTVNFIVHILYIFEHQVFYYTANPVVLAEKNIIAISTVKLALRYCEES